MKLPAKLDQGLVDPETMDFTPILVRQVRSLLEGVELPCGFIGCSHCDPDYDTDLEYAMWEAAGSFD